MSAPITEVNTFTASVQAPSPGDPEIANSVIQGLQALSNRTKWLKGDLATSTGFFIPFASSASNNVTLDTFTLDTYADSAGIWADVAASLVNDLFVVAFSFTAAITPAPSPPTSSTCGMRLVRVDDVAGTPASSTITSSERFLATPAGLDSWRGPIVIVASTICAKAGTTRIKLQGHGYSGNSTSLTTHGIWSVAGFRSRIS